MFTELSTLPGTKEAVGGVEVELVTGTRTKSGAVPALKVHKIHVHSLSLS